MACLMDHPANCPCEWRSAFLSAPKILTNTKAEPQPVVCGMMLLSAGLMPATYCPGLPGV